MIFRTLCLVSCLVSFASLTLACSSGGGEGENAPTGASGNGQTGAPAASGSASGAGPVYSISCNGSVSKPTSLDLDLSPRCINGPPGTKCASPGDKCKAQDVKFHYAPPALRCIGVDVYEWNGETCVVHNTHGEGGMLKCVGADCEALFASKEACTAHAEQCLATR